MRFVIIAAAVLCGLSLGAAAQDLPQFPKVGPPQSLPEPVCDVDKSASGDWLSGRWVSPHSRWEFRRDGAGWSWSLNRKGSVEDNFGWAEGARIEGAVDHISGCTLDISAGEGRFKFNGVLTENGKIYGIAFNPKGDEIRFVLRREH